MPDSRVLTRCSIVLPAPMLPVMISNASINAASTEDRAPFCAKLIPRYQSECGDRRLQEFPAIAPFHGSPSVSSDRLCAGGCFSGSWSHLQKPATHRDRRVMAGRSLAIGIECENLGGHGGSPFPGSRAFSHQSPLLINATWGRRRGHGPWQAGLRNRSKQVVRAKPWPRKVRRRRRGLREVVGFPAARRALCPL